MNLGLYICSFYFGQAKDKKSGTEYVLDLNSPVEYQDGVFCNALQVFEAFFASQKETLILTEEQKVFFIEQNAEWAGETDSFKFAMVKINSGSYGVESDIYDSETKKKVGKIDAGQAGVKPFVALVAIPKWNSKEVNKGILMFQTVGAFGVKTITTRLLKQYVKATLGINLHICNVGESEFLKNLFDAGTIKKLRLIKNKVSEDTSDKLGSSYATEERIISGILQTSAELVAKLIKFGLNKNEIFEWEPNNEFDQVKVEVNTEFGKPRTVDLRKFETFSIIENIPIKYQKENGHAEEIEIKKYLCSRAGHYLDRMDVSVKLIKR